MNWNQKILEEKKQQGLIRDYKYSKQSNSVELKTGGRIVAKHFQKRSKEKDYIAWNLLFWCNEKAVTLEEEYKFHPERNWRSDWAIAAFKILVEFEGGIFMQKSGHTKCKRH